MFHHLLNLQPQQKNRGSPNNNGDYYIPEVYERSVYMINKPLLFSSGFSITAHNILQMHMKITFDYTKLGLVTYVRVTNQSTLKCTLRSAPLALQAAKNMPQQLRISLN